MQLTPLEITQREFRKVLRGYDPEEVRHFIESVADDVGTLLKDNTAREERIAELEERVRALESQEESLRNTLVTAQRMTEEIKANAKREADLIIREAEGKAQRLAAEAQGRVAEAQRELLELQRQRDLFAATLRSHIQTHLELLQRGPRRDPKEPPPASG
ncbi:MAG TPA: DivIVA domain-containing protein [Candidatus Sulfotelmatobacter sp.]|nr:DivIVA domain-containing protein [Candidatus Sulfotelmatobacter sp.]